jgi:hypothetical protein
MIGTRLPRIVMTTPCSTDWESMEGDARVRRCPSCEKNVYNVSLMSRREVARLVGRTGQPLPCIRGYRRPDGTIIAGGCMSTVRRAMGWVRFKLALAAGVLVAIWSDASFARVRSSVVAAEPAPPRKPKKEQRPAQPRKPAPRASKSRPRPAPANGGIMFDD